MNSLPLNESGHVLCACKCGRPANIWIRWQPWIRKPAGWYSSECVPPLPVGERGSVDPIVDGAGAVA